MNWPLMQGNILWDDIELLKTWLGNSERDMLIPRLTQGAQVAAFENEFAAWLGTRYAVMVNSGASANLITIAALQFEGRAEIIVPTITWVSDIAAILHAGHTPVFVDVDPKTLGMDRYEIFKAINSHTRAVFVTHTLGFNALDDYTINRLRALGILIIEDCCEALGGMIGDRKLGTEGIMSNFSFYYAHHMSTIEGGMVCTDNPEMYRRLRQLRGHGLRRERGDEFEKEKDLDDFIFDYPAWNVRSTEINAVIGRSQLRRLNANNAKRTENLTAWLSNLGEKFFTDYRTEGSCNYALPLVLVGDNPELMKSVTDCLAENGVEFRRGTAGGGNQLRQPYLRKLYGDAYKKFPNTEHVHFNGLYIGNYPSLDPKKIVSLCEKLNAL